MKKVYRLLFILHAFVGIGAMFGGMMDILNPQRPGGMPTNALKYSPFSDFLIPGIILFTVIGLGNILCALGMHYRLKYQAYLSNIISWALVIWIIVQCIMLWSVVHLHIIFFIMGLIQGILSVITLFGDHLFPANMIVKMMTRLEKNFPANRFIRIIGKIIKNIYAFNHGI